MNKKTYMQKNVSINTKNQYKKFCNKNIYIMFKERKIYLRNNVYFIIFVNQLDIYLSKNTDLFFFYIKLTFGLMGLANNYKTDRKKKIF